MRLTLGLTLLALASAFTPSCVTKTHRLTTTQLELTRRDILTGIAASYMAAAAFTPVAEAVSSATFFEPEKLAEPAQMRQDGRVDLNSAFVVRYMYSCHVCWLRHWKLLLTFIKC
jgi:hypothetical protein